MRQRRSLKGTVAKIVAFTSVMAVCLVVVISAINRPVAGEVDDYRALFVDASGLKTGDDIRMYGVQVGEVTSISLDDNRAAVEFTVQRDRPFKSTSTMAIRYQTLTGQRYVDIRQSEKESDWQDPAETIPTEQTIPSFDITTVFNGLRPVLTEFSPEDLNKFAESLLAVVEGDGKGIGPALSAIEQLSRHVTDRQQLFSVLFRNLRQISDDIGGRSPDLTTLLQGLQNVFAELEEKMDGMLVFADAAPDVFLPLNNLMKTLGFTFPTNPDLEQTLRVLFPDPQAAVDELGKLPGLVQSLNSLIPEPGPIAGQVTLTCSKGTAPVPDVVKVLIAGQRISVCQS